MDFEPLVEGVYRQVLHPGGSAVDVGAHTGLHAIPMAEAVGSFGRIYAFEPLPESFAQLSASVEASGWKKVIECRQVALSDYSGNAEFHVAQDRPQESGLVRRSVYTGPTEVRSISVDVSTIDAELDQDEQIDFIKMDVEGGEYAVLRGALETIIKHEPVVCFEFGRNSADSYNVDPAQMFQTWDSLGYWLLSIDGELLTDADTFTLSSTQQLLWDYVAVPRRESLNAIRTGMASRYEKLKRRERYRQMIRRSSVGELYKRMRRL